MIKKRRVNYNFTEQQHAMLKQHAEAKELSVSELLRRIIDEWLEVNPIQVNDKKKSPLRAVGDGDH